MIVTDLEGRARERERQSWMLGNFTFSLPGFGKLPVDCECSHLQTSISTFFPFSFWFPFPGYCGSTFSFQGQRKLKTSKCNFSTRGRPELRDLLVCHRGGSGRLSNANYIPPEVVPAAVQFWLMGEGPGRGRNPLAVTLVIFYKQAGHGGLCSEGKISLPAGLFQ